jgi:N-acetylglucosaminyldiphosphoundecaprenol N-acetyl-beta-D-mannosaminyltransferase
MIKFNLAAGEDSMFENCKDYSFINPSSLDLLIRANKDYSSIQFGVDGGLLAVILSNIMGTKIRRVSFDYTSIAKRVFKQAQSNGLKIALVGAEQVELDRFTKRISLEYPELNISYTHSGYFNEADLNEMAGEIVKCDVLICSMGAVRQEDFILAIRKAGFVGISYTCGGFFRQHASSENENYYPDWVNSLNLRAFYRMYKEPHTINRYFFNYPVSLGNLAYLRLMRKIELIAG